MSINWIFFDVGSTLVDETVAYDHRARDMIASTNITFDEFNQVRISLAKQGLDGNSATIKHFGLSKTPWHSEDEVLYFDSYDTLAALRAKGYKLGIIANQNLGTSERLKAWNLYHFFDLIVASEEIGFAKPDKRIFEVAFDLANCHPSECVMVGDRLDNDMMPAKDLGMTTVWIKNGLAVYQDARYAKNIVDYTIFNLSDLLSIL